MDYPNILKAGPVRWSARAFTHRPPKNAGVTGSRDTASGLLAINDRRPRRRTRTRDASTDSRYPAHETDHRPAGQVADRAARTAPSTLGPYHDRSPRTARSASGTLRLPWPTPGVETDHTSGGSARTWRRSPSSQTPLGLGRQGTDHLHRLGAHDERDRRSWARSRPEPCRPANSRARMAAVTWSARSAGKGWGKDSRPSLVARPRAVVSSGCPHFPAGRVLVVPAGREGDEVSVHGSLFVSRPIAMTSRRIRPRTRFVAHLIDEIVYFVLGHGR